MRRTLVLRQAVGKRGPAAAGREPVAEGRGLPAQAREFLGKLQHRPVLLGDVPLEVGDFLFEAFNAFVQRSGGRRP